MQEITFGVVGTGSMAATMMAALQAAPGVRVAAVYSHSAERAAQFAASFGLAKSFSTLDSMLSDNSLDAIYIANATAQHRAVAISALQAGKAVLCEKPCATTPQEMQAILDAAKASQKLFMEGLWTLCLPAYQPLFTTEAAGLGKIKHLSASFGYPASSLSYPQLFAQSGGGVLLDRAVYLLALACALLGEVEQVTALVDKNSAGIDTQASILLRHRQGGSSQLTASLDALLANDITLGCENGSLQLPAPALGAEHVVKQFFLGHKVARQEASSPGKPGLGQKLKSLSCLRRANFLRSRLKAEHHSFGGNPYSPQISHFCELLRSGRRESARVPHTLSRQIIELVEQIRAQTNVR